MTLDYYYIETERQMARIVGAAPSFKSEDERFLMQALEQEPTARLFVRYAENTDWLLWAHERGIIDPLFVAGVESTSVHRILAYWISERYVSTAASELLHLIAEYGCAMHSVLWHAIMWQLAYGKERPHGELLAVWVSIMLPLAPQDHLSQESLDSLLLHCEWPRDKNALMSLFSHLLSTVPMPETSMAFVFDHSPNRFEYRVELRGSEDSLRETWDRLKNHCEEIWRRLLSTHST